MCKYIHVIIRVYVDPGVAAAADAASGLGATVNFQLGREAGIDEVPANMRWETVICIRSSDVRGPATAAQVSGWLCRSPQSTYFSSRQSVATDATDPESPLPHVWQRYHHRKPAQAQQASFQLTEHAPRLGDSPGGSGRSRSASEVICHPSSDLLSCWTSDVREFAK